MNDRKNFKNSNNKNVDLSGNFFNQQPENVRYIEGQPYPVAVVDVQSDQPQTVFLEGFNKNVNYVLTRENNVMKLRNNVKYRRMDAVADEEMTEKSDEIGLQRHRFLGAYQKYAPPPAKYIGEPYLVVKNNAEARNVHKKNVQAQFRKGKDGGPKRTPGLAEDPYGYSGHSWQ